MDGQKNITKHFLIVSSIFPSGVAWILNFLLELDILVYRGEDISAVWREKENKSYVIKQGGLRQWIPALEESRVFRFRDNLAVKWSHKFPNGGNLDKKIILLTRDGRDAVYSQYKREQINGNLKLALRRMEPPLSLPYQEWWALFNYVWARVVPIDDLLKISFEEIKFNPSLATRKLLDFLGIKRTAEEISRAIELSAVERAKTAETEYLKTQPEVVQFSLVNRKGKPGEWRDAYTEKEHYYFDGFPALVLKEFGYEIAGREVKESTEKQEIYEYGFREYFNDVKLLIDKRYWRLVKSRLQKILNGIGKKENDIKKFMTAGRMLVVLEWLEKIYIKDFIKDESAAKVFWLFFDATGFMRRGFFMKINIVRNLNKIGCYKQALKIVEEILNFDISNFEKFEVGKALLVHSKTRAKGVEIEKGVLFNNNELVDRARLSSLDFVAEGNFRAAYALMRIITNKKIKIIFLLTFVYLKALLKKVLPDRIIRFLSSVKSGKI